MPKCRERMVEGSAVRPFSFLKSPLPLFFGVEGRVNKMYMRRRWLDPQQSSSSSHSHKHPDCCLEVHATGVRRCGLGTVQPGWRDLLGIGAVIPRQLERMDACRMCRIPRR